MSPLERRRPSAGLSARSVHEARGEAHAGVALLDGCGPRALADGRGGDVEFGGDLAPRQPLPQEFGDSPPRRCAAMPEQVQQRQGRVEVGPRLGRRRSPRRGPTSTASRAAMNASPEAARTSSGTGVTTAPMPTPTRQHPRRASCSSASTVSLERVNRAWISSPAVRAKPRADPPLDGRARSARRAEGTASPPERLST